MAKKTKEELEAEQAAKDPYERLKPQYRRFVDEYLSNRFNAAKAAEVAGYAQPQSQGPRLLRNVEIATAIDYRLEQDALSRARILHELAVVASLDMSPFIRYSYATKAQPPDTKDPFFWDEDLDDEDEEGDEDESDDTPRNPNDKKAILVPAAPFIDLKALIDAGYGSAIKAIKKTKHGYNVEFHDKIKTLELLGKELKMWVDRHSIEDPDGKPIMNFAGMVEVMNAAKEMNSAERPDAPKPQ